MKKLRWQSRRGMKELDVLLEAFLNQHSEALSIGQWPEFEYLLSQEDDCLFDWISGRNLPGDRAVCLLIKDITNVLQ